MILRVKTKTPFKNWLRAIYRLSHLHQLASRVPLLAMASWCFFPSGLVPRHLWGVYPPWFTSQVNVLAMAIKTLLLPLLVLDYSPLRVGGEVVASEWAFLLLFADVARHCELEAYWRRVNEPFCSSCPFCTFFLFSSLLGVLSNFPAKLGKVR